MPPRDTKQNSSIPKQSEPAQHAAPAVDLDPNAIRNECQDIDRDITHFERILEEVCAAQERVIHDTETSSSSQANLRLQSLSVDLMTDCRQLTQRVRALKSKPDARRTKNRAQVDRVDCNLKQAVQEYQQSKSQFYKRTQDHMARQYRIVRPEATTDEEVRAAVEDSADNGQVFVQAFLQSSRQGKTRVALANVQDRHRALVMIEQQTVELSQLFQDMNTLIVQQDDALARIEKNGEDTVEKLEQGNTEISGAVVGARKARRKKWICLGICATIVVVVIIVVLIWWFVIKMQAEAATGK